LRRGGCASRQEKDEVLIDRHVSLESGGIRVAVQHDFVFGFEVTLCSGCVGRWWCRDVGSGHSDPAVDQHISDRAGVTRLGRTAQGHQAYGDQTGRECWVSDAHVTAPWGYAVRLIEIGRRSSR